MFQNTKRPTKPPCSLQSKGGKTRKHEDENPRISFYNHKGLSLFYPSKPSTNLLPKSLNSALHVLFLDFFKKQLAPFSFQIRLYISRACLLRVLARLACSENMINVQRLMIYDLPPGYPYAFLRGAKIRAFWEVSSSNCFFN